MNNIINNIKSQMARTTDRDVLKHLEIKHRYAIAKSKGKGTVNTFRTQEIARRVQEKYSIDRQLEILCNADPSEIALIKEHRANVTIEVDTLIATFDAELNAELEAQ